MGKKPETTFKEKVLLDMRALPHTWVTKIQQVTIRGVPDILACLNGDFVALELKKDEKAQVMGLQKYNLAKITEAGGYAFTATPLSWPSVYANLKSIAKGVDMPKKKKKAKKAKKRTSAKKRKY